VKTLFGKHLWVVSLACAAFAVTGTVILADDPPRYSPWSEPTNLGLVVNSAAQEGGQCISRDELSLYFNSNRPGGFGGSDLYVTHRASKDAPWEVPINLGSNINTSDSENACALSADEHKLYFQSNHPGGLGGLDLYVSRRHNRRDDSAWQPAVNLGSPVNTSANEFYVGYYEDDDTGTITLFFSTNWPGGQGAQEIYASTLQPDETWGKPVIVPALNSPNFDGQVAVSRNGLELFLASNRPGSLGTYDVWVSTRASTDQPWPTPVNLGPNVNNTGSNQGHPAISADGKSLYFYSNRPGGYGDLDIYVSTRTKLKGKE
jgi:hypothetical protein